jgi:RNA polymerase sigma-70 factor (ECF subfamily)
MLRREISYSELESTVGLSAEENLFVLRLQANDDAAYDELVRSYHGSIYQVASRMLADPGEAADVTQDIFVKVFRNINGFKGEAALKTWIFKIAFSEILNRLRWFKRRHRNRTVFLDEAKSNGDDSTAVQVRDESPTPEGAFESKERGEAIQHALSKLSEQHRSIIVRDIQGCTYSEIAQILSISIGTVKSRLARARADLKKCLMRYLSVRRIG